MRYLSKKEQETIKPGKVFTTVSIDGYKRKLNIVVSYGDFTPDEKHTNEAMSDGTSRCYIVSLVNAFNNELDNRFYTDCTESEVLIQVGNFMGTVFNYNQLQDYTYLNSIIDPDIGEKYKWYTDSEGNIRIREVGDFDGDTIQ